jgi:ketosteroid isomerase-like protein
MTIKTRDEAIRFARSYLDAMEARDLDAAARYLADQVSLTFPGGAVFRSVAEIANNSGSRYARVGKIIESWDAFESGDGWIVYCRGSLHGEWREGQAFSGIRFIDRFEITHLGIRRQDVWNDSGEYRLALSQSQR